MQRLCDAAAEEILNNYPSSLGEHLRPGGDSDRLFNLFHYRLRVLLPLPGLADYLFITPIP